MQSGLYIVGTPIGNLGDFSPRAADVLRAADLIACEDTRVAGKLAARFGIKTRRVALHEHNEREAAPALAAKILDGAAVALVSDSGMPAISDPGFRLVRACRDAGAAVFVVPGPTALASALVLSGFPTDRFSFLGFLPSAAGAREAALRRDNKIRHTIIYYESPARVMDAIGAMARIMPERRVAIAREITKIHEETIIGYPAELIAKHADRRAARASPFKGEIVLVIEPAPDAKVSDEEISAIVGDALAGPHRTKSSAAEIAAKTGLSRKDAYKMALGGAK